MNECLITIERFDDNRLRLDIVAPGAPGLNVRKRIWRRLPLPAFIEQDLVQELRFGEADETRVAEASVKISKWFSESDPELKTIDPRLNLSRNELQLDSLLGFNDPDLHWRIALYFPDDQEQSAGQILFDLLDVPIELLRPSPNINTEPFVLNRSVSSLVHLLDGISNPTSRTYDWPLRVLMVRSDPYDNVPEALPLREAILAFRPDLATDLIEIDVLSKENGSGVIGKPTKDDVRKAMNAKNYHILAYLGHGDVREILPPPHPPLGFLLLENASGDQEDPLEAGDLATLLHKQTYAVPVVLLLGCLTAAKYQSFPQEVKENVPVWVRGNQSVAQAVAQSGVQYTVGMRCRIDEEDAKTFLLAFFESLLQKDPGAGNESIAGNVEVAIREARVQLKIKRRLNLAMGWAAPIVYSTRGDEPVFGFLRTPPVAATAQPAIPNAPAAIQPPFDKRATIWDTLALTNFSIQPLINRITQLRDEADEDIIENIRKQQGVLLMPAPLLVPPGTAQATGVLNVFLPDTLDKTLPFQSLAGDLVLGEGEVTVKAVTLSPRLKRAGFKLETKKIDPNQIHFTLTHPTGSPLMSERVLEVALECNTARSFFTTIDLQKVQIEPNVPLATYPNALVVPPP